MALLKTLSIHNQERAMKARKQKQKYMPHIKKTHQNNN